MTKPLMRIGVVCPYDLSKPGGVQQQCIGLVSALQMAGHRVELVGPGSGDTWTSVGSSLSVAINGSRAPVAAHPRVFRTVRQALYNSDVIHIHEPFVPATGPAALSLSLPTVATFHADPSRPMRGAYRLAGRAIRRVMKGTTVTAVSPVAASAVRSLGLRVRLVANAIDIPRFRNGVVRRMPRRVAFVGRDEPRKGLDVLVSAWTIVRSKIPDAELVVVGARRRPIDGVTFLGRIDEERKIGVLQSSVIAVAPNLGGESFGIVLAEAMAAGCAVVASDIPAFRFVTAGAGRFVEPGDVFGLAAALLDLLEQPETRNRLASDAASVVERYAWDTIANRYVALYHEASTSL